MTALGPARAAATERDSDANRKKRPSFYRHGPGRRERTSTFDDRAALTPRETPAERDHAAGRLAGARRKHPRRDGSAARRGGAPGFSRVAQLPSGLLGRATPSGIFGVLRIGGELPHLSYASFGQIPSLRNMTEAFPRKWNCPGADRRVPAFGRRLSATRPARAEEPGPSAPCRVCGGKRGAESWDAGEGGRGGKRGMREMGCGRGGRPLRGERRRGAGRS